MSITGCGTGRGVPHAIGGSAAGSETVLLALDNLSSATNHNGGALAFGTDGKLYIASGDNATGSNAQSFSTVKGKILRINADGTIPSDNPFFGSASGNNRAMSAWATAVTLARS